MRTAKRIGAATAVAFLAAILLRYPALAFLFDAASLKEKQPWHDGLAIWCQWDCRIYASLAGSYGPEQSVFFPVFPLVMQGTRAVISGLSGAGAAVSVSIAFTLLATLFLFHLGRQLWAPSIGAEPGGTDFLLWPRKAWVFVVAVSLYPFSNFWVSGYSEPLLVCLMAGTLLCAAQGRWLWGAALVGLAAVTRPQGVWVAAIFGLFYAWRLYREKATRSWPRTLGPLALAAVLVTVPFGLFLYWQWQTTGDPLHFLALQRQGWGREFSILEALKCHRPGFSVEFLSLVVSVYASIRFLKRDEAHWKLLGLWTLALAELPVFFGGYYSYVRFVSINLGLFAFITEAVWKRSWLGYGLLIWALTRLGIQVYHYSNGLWAG